MTISPVGTPLDTTAASIRADPGVMFELPTDRIDISIGVRPGTDGLRTPAKDIMTNAVKAAVVADPV